MECFDHGKEMEAMCGWCGKNLCPNCVGRQDGRKKYCRDCATKMGDFRPKEQAAPDATPAHEEQPRITPIALNMVSHVSKLPQRSVIAPASAPESMFAPPSASKYNS